MTLESFGIIQTRALSICKKSAVLRTYAAICSFADPIHNIPAYISASQLTERLKDNNHSKHIKELVALGLITVGESFRAKGAMQTKTEYFVNNLRTDEDIASFPHYFLVSTDAITQINSNDLHVYLVLLSYANHSTNTCWPTRETIAQRAGISLLDTVSTRTTSLEKAGWISVEHRHNTSNIYTVSYTKTSNQPTSSPKTKAKTGQGVYRTTTQDENGNTIVLTTSIPLNGVSSRQMDKITKANEVSSLRADYAKLIQKLGLEEIAPGKFVDSDGVLVEL